MKKPKNPREMEEKEEGGNEWSLDELLTSYKHSVFDTALKVTTQTL